MDPSTANDIRIAVLAVHGVADQQPAESARAISNLLLNLNDAGKPLYRSFRETGQRIQTRALPVVSKTGAFKLWVQKQLRDPKDRPQGIRIDQAFLRAQLECYRGEDPDTHHETVLLEGEREESNTQVHIYEMYWADLSRFGRGLFRMFGEVYQILLHLPSVGVHTLRAAQLDHGGDAKWSALVGIHVFTARFLSIAIASINLFLLACSMTLALAGALSKAPIKFQWGTISIALVALVTAGVCYALHARGKPVSIAAIGFIAFGSAMAPAIAWATASNPAAAPFWLMSLPWVEVCLTGALCLGGLAYIINRYDKQRPGSRSWGIGVIVGAMAAFAFSIADRSPVAEQQLPDLFLAQYAPWLYLLRATETGAIISGVFWAIFYCAALACFGIGLWAVRIDDSKARRARWTAQLTLAGSAVFFTLITVTLWAGITQAFSPLLPDPMYHDEPVKYAWVGKPPGPVTDFGEELLLSSSLLVPFQAASVLLALVIAMIGLTPSILREASPLRGDSATGKASRNMGAWLTSANVAMLWSGRVIWWTVAIIMPALVILPAKMFPEEWLRSVAQPFMASIGKAVASSAVGVFALARNLKTLAGLLAPLDVVLDVDNYLRENPRESNPTARIFARYASILRTICKQNYHALIIVAHSQGTVITADFLRFLHIEADEARRRNEPYEPALSRILKKDLPIYFFTMGSPLRNLYGQRFPHLYGWARPEIDTKTCDLPACEPDPEPLGVRMWVNAFRSGDYIGRHLWRTDQHPDPWKTPDCPLQAPPPPDNGPWDVRKEMPINVSQDASRTRREFCIGPGAHTHYWDDTAAPIACELDRLIRIASGAG